MVVEGWKEKEIGKLIEVVPGFAFKSEFFSDNAGIPLIRIRDLLTHNPKTYYNDKVPDGFEINSHDILIGMDGDFHIVHWRGPKGLLNQRVCKVYAKNSNLLDTNYLFYYLQPQLLVLNNKISATTVKHLSTKHIRGLCGLLPPLLEQKKIAEILKSVDDAIAMTEAVIAQTQRVKQGLLQELLTRGIGHTKFKQTDLGEIPERWEVVKLEEVAEINPKRFVAIPDETHITFLSMADLSEEAKIVSPQIKKYKDVKKGFTYFSDNDVLVAKITPCFENGKGAFVQNLVFGHGAGSTEFHVIRANRNLVLPSLIYIYSTSLNFRKNGAQNMKGSAGQKRVPKDFLEQYMIALPSLKEQKAICSIANDFDFSISQLKNELISLKSTKSGLMSDLLTGRVRVNVDKEKPVTKTGVAA